MSEYVVRYGVMRLLGVFSVTAGRGYPRGAKVIAGPTEAWRRARCSARLLPTPWAS